MVKGKRKAIGQRFLDAPHFGTILVYRLASFFRSDLRWRAVLVCRADEHHLITAHTLVACKDICGQLAAHKIAQMLDPVDIFVVGTCALAHPTFRGQSVMRFSPEQLAKDKAGAGNIGVGCPHFTGGPGQHADKAEKGENGVGHSDHRKKRAGAEVLDQ